MSPQFTRGHRSQAGSVCQRVSECQFILCRSFFRLCHFLCLAWLIHHFPSFIFFFFFVSFGLSSRPIFVCPSDLPPVHSFRPHFTSFSTLFSLLHSLYASFLSAPLPSHILSLHCAPWPFMGSVLRAKSPSGRAALSRFPGFKVECTAAGFLTGEQQV